MSSTDLPDVNVLFALHQVGHSLHEMASLWLDRTHLFATCPMTEAGLVRLMLSPEATGEPIAGADVLTRLRVLRAHHKATFWADDASLAQSPTVTRVLQGRKQVTDLHLLALAASRNGRLVTFDTKIAAPLSRAERRHLHVLG